MCTTHSYIRRKCWFRVRASVGQKLAHNFSSPELCLSFGSNEKPPILNSFLDKTMFIFLYLSAMILTLSTNCGKLSTHTRMSSTIFLAYGRPFKTVSECLQHSSDKAFFPHIFAFTQNTVLQSGETYTIVW